MIIKAPLTKGQMNSINAFQKYSIFHQYTCENWADANHKSGILIALIGGLFCRECEYTQDWVHDWTANWEWKKVEP